MSKYLIARNLFGDAFDTFFRPTCCGEDSENMKTDITDLDDKYEMTINMPGFDKEDMQIEFKKGYITVSASKTEKEEDTKKYYLRERNVSCSRSYYLGEVNEENIKAKYENGMLSVSIPKKTAEVNNTILIE